MFRDILSGSRAIFIGVVFFVLVVGGSLLYSWHVHRTTDAELAETQRKVQPLKNDETARPTQGTVDTSTVDFEHVGTNLETDDAQMSDDTGVSPIDEISETLDMAEAFLPDDFVPEEAQVSEDVPVSPFGFGAYPDIPEDLRSSMGFTAVWEDVGWPDIPFARKSELFDRVLIKVWNNGDRNWIGASTNGNKVYLNYPNTIYVWYGDPIENPDGTVTVPFSDVDGMLLTEQQLRSGKAPPGVTVLDGESEGIDMFQYLDFPSN